MNRDRRQILTELLILRIQGRDDTAFTSLYELWNHDVQRWAYVSTDSQNAVPEVSQDAWIAVARGVGRLQDPACFPRWLFQIVRRRGADWVRRRQRDRKLAERAAEDQAESPDAGSVPAYSATPLQVAVEALPLAERELVSLFYELGRSVAEVAEILEVPTGTVKSRLYALRERLRNEIEKEKP